MIVLIINLLRRNYICFFTMKAFLNNDSNLSQIQNRLSRYAFLTRNNLPGFPDALFFLTLNQMHKYPDSKKYPHFYHWFILIKQFSTKTINSWLSKSCPPSQDSLVNYFLSIQERCSSQTFKHQNEFSMLKIKKNSSETTQEQVLTNKFMMMVRQAKIKENCQKLLKRKLFALRIQMQKGIVYDEFSFRLSGDYKRFEQTLTTIEELMEFSIIEVKKQKHSKIHI